LSAVVLDGESSKSGVRVGVLVARGVVKITFMPKAVAV